MSQFTARAKMFAQSVLTPEGMPDEANPFQSENGVWYLRYDSIQIENADDAFGGVNVGFKWRGAVMCRTRIEGAQLVPARILELLRIEGRQRVTIA